MRATDDFTFSSGRIALRPSRPAAAPAVVETVMLGHCPGRADWRQLLAMPGLAERIELLGFDRQIRALRAIEARGGFAESEAERRLIGLIELPLPITSPTQFDALFPEARTELTVRRSRLAGRSAWLPFAVDDFFARGPGDVERTLWLIRVREEDGVEAFLPRADADWFSTDPYEALGPFEMACLPPLAGFVAFPDLERLQIPSTLTDIAALDQPKLEPAFLPCDGDPPPDLPTVIPEQSAPTEPRAFSPILYRIAEAGRRIRPDMHFLVTLPFAPEDVVDRGYPAPSPEALSAADGLRGHPAENGLAQIQLVYPYLRSPDRTLASPAGLIAGRMVTSTVQNGAWASIAGRPLSRLQQAYPPQTPQAIRSLRDEHGIGVLDSSSGALELDDERLTRPSFLTRSRTGSGEVARFLGWLRRELRQFGERLVFLTDPDDPRPAMALDALFRRLYASGALAGRVAEESYAIRQSSEGVGTLVFEIGLNIALPIDRILVTFAEDRLDIGLAESGGR